MTGAVGTLEQAADTGMSLGAALMFTDAQTELINQALATIKR
jgi:hypothetical protein